MIRVAKTENAAEQNHAKTAQQTKCCIFDIHYRGF